MLHAKIYPICALPSGRIVLGPPAFDAWAWPVPSSISRFAHLVGKAAPEILKQYVGVYEYKPPAHPEDPVLIEVTLEGEHLMVALSGGAKITVTALSETKFFFEGAHIEFFKDEHGAVTYLIAQTVEGDLKAPRK
jgi:hypothetical protein